MKILEYIHATLIIMLIIPFLYALAELTEAGGAPMLYAKCALIAIPVAASDIAVRKIRALGLYLPVSVVIIAALYGFMRLIFGKSGFCYTAVMLAEGVIIVFARLQERIRLSQQEKEDDIYAKPAVSLLNKPSIGCIWYFAAMYLLGIIFNSSALCDIAFVNAIIYFFAAFAYSYMGATAHYLSMNRRTSNIPVKRLYAVSAAAAGAFAGLVLLAILPSIILAGHRHYTDIRTWFSDMEFSSSTPEHELLPAEIYGGMAAEQITLMEDEALPTSEPSILWEYLLYAFLAALGAAIIYGAVRLVKQLFYNFRNSFDENGDKAEDLEDDDSYKTAGLRRHRRIRGGSEAMRIRRLYKRTIRKHRKETPAPHESPTELEEKAGLLGDEAMGALHTAYELVRYGEGE